MQVELRSIISVPMRVKGTVIGALQVVDKQVGRFDQSHGMVLEALADASATAIENAQLFEQANREIVERKRAEKKLKKNEKELKDKSIALKEIAQILNASAKTIEAHRHRLRKKLGLTNQRIQLRDYLMTLV